MSYCRWSTPMLEDHPGVLDFWEYWEQHGKSGDYVEYFAYLDDHGVARSDAYVWADVSGGYRCAWGLTDTHTTATAAEMATYLEEHKTAGRRIPQSAIDQLKEETNDD